MPIDLDKFKGKTLDGETLTQVLAAITEHTDTLEARATTAEDKARKAAKESIDGRKALKAERDKAFEKLGISDAEELESLPDARGQGEATKQLEAKLKKAERDLAEKAAALEDLTGRYSAEQLNRSIAEEVAKHPFIDAEDARALVSGRVKREGDELLFSGPDGKTVPLSDGVAWLAKTKTHLVRPAGDQQQGSGFKGQQGGNVPAKQPVRSDFANEVEFFKAASAFHAQQAAA